MKEKTTNRSTTFTCRRHHGDGGHNGDGDHDADDDTDGGGDVNDRLNDNWMMRSRQWCKDAPTHDQQIMRLVMMIMSMNNVNE